MQLAICGRNVSCVAELLHLGAIVEEFAFEWVDSSENSAFDKRLLTWMLQGAQRSTSLTLPHPNAPDLQPAAEEDARSRLKRRRAEEDSAEAERQQSQAKRPIHDRTYFYD